MKQRSVYAGFSIVEVILVVAVLALIGFLGYRIYSSQQVPVQQSATASDVSAAPAAISTTADLDTASVILDQTDPSGSNATDANQLDTQLSAF